MAPTARFELAERLSAAGESAEAAGFYGAVLAAPAEGPISVELAHKARYGLAWCQFDTRKFAESERELRTLALDKEAPLALRTSAWELSIWSACEQALQEPGMD